MKNFILLILSICFSTNIFAAITLPKILGSNMILQQQSNVNLWGKAKPNCKVKITASWSSDKIQTQSDNEGRWAVKIATPAASFTPHTIVISDGEKLQLDNILIGDVWICSGQSNMEMPVMGFNNQSVEHSLEHIIAAKALENNIHSFKVGWARSYDKEQEDCVSGEWLSASSESIANLSATAYYFAYHLTKALNIPIGVITPYWGGTRIESWMSLGALRECVTPEQYEQKQNCHSIKPSELYCAMIAPIRNFTAKGFIWYQGESNLGDNDHYETMMARMVSQWRNDWEDKNNSMPFYYVQIAPYTYGNSKEIAYPRFVESQVRALDIIPNCGMATTTDLGLEYSIHPHKKLEVGQRLAALALTQTYGLKGFEPKAPLMDSYEIKDGKVIISFRNAERGLIPWEEGPAFGFEVAGADRVFHPAKVQVSDKRVFVWSDEVKEPVAARYSFHNYAPGNLKSTYGIAVPPFRTDNWNDVK